MFTPQDSIDTPN